MQIAPDTVILSAPFHCIVVFEVNRNLLSYLYVYTYCSIVEGFICPKKMYSNYTA